MDLKAIITALDAAQKVETPTTKKQAEKIAKELAPELEKLREYLSELNEKLESVEENVENLKDADSEDREDAYEQLEEDAYALWEMLTELLKDNVQVTWAGLLPTLK